jgi:hypothetical protein
MWPRWVKLGPNGSKETQWGGRGPNGAEWGPKGRTWWHKPNRVKLGDRGRTGTNGAKNGRMKLKGGNMQDKTGLNRKNRAHVELELWLS